ncbi:MAG: hypothetical protein WBK51_16505 [Polaromonas sp.]
MDEHQAPSVMQQTIPQSVMLAVLNRCDDMREFMVEMWRANPQLAKQGGAKVAMLLSASENNAGISDDVARHT